MLSGLERSPSDERSGTVHLRICLSRIDGPEIEEEESRHPDGDAMYRVREYRPTESETAVALRMGRHRVTRMISIASKVISNLAVVISHD